MRDCVVVLNVTCPRRPACLVVVVARPRSGVGDGRRRHLGKENRSNRWRIFCPIPFIDVIPCPKLS